MFRNSVLKIFVLLCSFSQILCDDESLQRQPVYKYRYETEDMMKTSASSSPVRGYHVVEQGGYYPAESGLIGAAIGPVGGGGIGIGGGQFIGGGVGHLGYGGIGGGGGGIGGAGIGGAGLGGGGIGYGVGPIGAGGIGYGHIAGPHFIGGGGVGSGIGAGGYGGGGIGLGGGSIGVGGGNIGVGGGSIGIGGGGIGIGGGGIGIGGGYGGHGYGGEELDKSQFSGEKKNLADAKYENTHGKKGEVINHGQEGYTKGVQGVKDIKGEDGYYSNAGGGKNVVNDGKQYHGGQNFNQEGKNGEENQNKKGHKKGHKIKGFKSSHHKDESGKTEEFYDEEHDEGDNFLFKGQNGAFGQQGASTYKGGHLDDKFNEAEHKKSGHVANEFALKKENADEGKYGENKYAGGGSTYGVNNGFDQQSLLGHQENAKFFKHHQVPFYHHY